MLPAPVVEKINGVYVLRDDLLDGGTKRRAIGAVLTGADEFVYAGPVQGFAQIALAYGCRDRGLRATVFVAKRKELHPRTAEAKSAGATVYEIPYGYLSNVTARAREYCERTGAVLLPFGLDCPEFINALANVARKSFKKPDEIWSAAGSGVLTRAFQIAWPNARHNVVVVGNQPKTENARRFTAHEKYDQNAKRPPPFPSCGNYDAKVWEFVMEYGSPGCLFWNVAR